MFHNNYLDGMVFKFVDFYLKSQFCIVVGKPLRVADIEMKRLNQTAVWCGGIFKDHFAVAFADQIGRYHLDVLA